MHISKYELMHLKEKKKFRSSPHSVNLHHQHFLMGGGDQNVLRACFEFYCLIVIQSKKWATEMDLSVHLQMNLVTRIHQTNMAVMNRTDCIGTVTLYNCKTEPSEQNGNSNRSIHIHAAA